MGYDNANARQHGGDHYKKHEYQHWDFVCDLRLPYLIGCATKYVSRWRYKGGVLDLKKAIHYLEKAMEKQLPGEPWTYYRTQQQAADRFVRQHESEDDKLALRFILAGNYEEAIGVLDDLIEENTPGSDA